MRFLGQKGSVRVPAREPSFFYPGPISSGLAEDLPGKKAILAIFVGPKRGVTFSNIVDFGQNRWCFFEKRPLSLPMLAPFIGVSIRNYTKTGYVAFWGEIFIFQKK